MAEPSGTFAGLLRELRRRARLTQEELADAAGTSLRTVSDLERGVATTPQKETVRLLADALHLIGPERVQFETLARGRPLASGSPAAAAPMRSLPRDVASFTGRQRELEQLTKSAMTAGGVVDIHAIGGMAGVGKTAFAVHAAHQLADRFPGGQIFLLLHGHTPGQQPVDPADALASLLLTIGIPAAQVPLGLEARAALWRDRVAGRQLLLVLDDAASSEQVRPLVPGAGGSLVLVTSRRHLSALDDATAISLDTLPPGEAAALLVRLAGRAALSSDDPAVLEVARLCGFLPLAIGMLARQLRHHPAWTVAGRAAELASARDRLELLETEHLSVAAAFDLSYATLTPDRQRLFRRLGLHPGADMDGYAAAALDGTSLSAARRGLEALYDQYLLTEPAEGRYRLHDLIREHARALAGRVDPDEGRDAATARLLDYYQHAAAVANARITGRARPEQAADGAVPTAVPALHDQEQALAWARAERASLLACLDHAVGTGQHGRVTALTAGLSGLLQHDGPWADAVGRHTVAAQAAQYLGDHLSQANALNDLGEVQRLMGDYPAAVRASEEALGVYRDLGNRLGQATAMNSLGRMLRVMGDYPAAVRASEEALAIYRDLGNRLGQANALSSLGRMLRVTGDYPAAVRASEEALAIYRDIGDRGGEVEALNDRGALHRASGEPALAEGYHRQSLELSRDIASSWDEAHALAGLGRCGLDAGHTAQAEDLLRQALEIFQRIGAAEAQELLAELDDLAGPPPHGG
jgi:tetratricopeptide (TPR) repeat protein/transcriptional regulator with XRE-family HTH domain